MATFQHSAVLYYLGGDFGERQLSTVSSPALKTKLIDFITSEGGTADIDWYKLPTATAFKAVIDYTKTLGGVVYNLPPRT